MPFVARAIVVLVVALLLAMQVVRTALVADPSTRKTLAERLWPSHPAVLTNRTMMEIGAHAASGEPPPAATLRRVEEIARRAPLAPEPFLIKGAMAQVEDDQQRAERLFVAARDRDPRSAAARYFLAERYLRTRRVGQALTEIAVMSRLFPEARAQFGPALAAFARTPGAVPQLRSFFRSSPEVEPLVLLHLAEDARNADLVLALWGRRPHGAGEPAPEWQAKLVNKLIEQGQFAKAHATWRLVAGVRDGPGTIFNPEFREIAAPPPFNWVFSASGGVVEPAPGDRLQVIYYGRSDTVLAEQLLLLRPGRYRLGMDISGPLREGGEIAWTVSCLPGGETVLQLPVARKGRVEGSFLVQPGCAAQRLRLVASIGDFPQSQEFTVGRLSLARGPAQ